ncbi:hypothetical protein ABPG73_013324 [Tetrahymena malaccensis]
MRTGSWRNPRSENKIVNQKKTNIQSQNHLRSEIFWCYQYPIFIKDSISLNQQLKISKQKNRKETLQHLIMNSDQQNIQKDQSLTTKQLLDNCYSHLQNNPQLISQATGKSIVILLGITGAGKSTLVNYLANQQMEITISKGRYKFEPINQKACKVGNTNQSCTVYPECVTAQDYHLYDFGGVWDSRGLSESITIKSFIFQILKVAKEVTILLVIDYATIFSSKGVTFNEFVSGVEKMFQGIQINEKSAVIITKVPDLFSCQDEFDQFVKDINEAPIRLTQFKKIERFSVPINQKLCEKERENIWKVIKDLQPVQINQVILEGLFSKDDFEQVRNIYREEFINILKDLNLQKNNLNSSSDYYQEQGRLKQCLKIWQKKINENSAFNILKPISASIFQEQFQEQNKLVNTLIQLRLEENKTFKTNENHINKTNEIKQLNQQVKNMEQQIQSLQKAQIHLKKQNELPNQKIQNFEEIRKNLQDFQKQNELPNQKIQKFEENRKKLYDFLYKNEYQIEKFHKQQIYKYGERIYDYGSYEFPRFPQNFESPKKIIKQIGLTQEDLDQQPELIKIIELWQKKFEINYLYEELEVNRQYHNRSVNMLSTMSSNLSTQLSSLSTGGEIMILGLALIATPIITIASVVGSMIGYFFG